MNSTTKDSQQRAARLAGLMYLLTIVTWAFAFYVRSGLIVDGNASETVNNIVTNARLFRISIVSDLVTFAGVVVLTVALWVLLKPVNRDIALLAAFWRLVESSILCVITLSSFLVLYLSSGAEYLKAIEAGQLQALAMLTIALYGTGWIVGPIFLGLGSAAFSYLLFQSRYVPRALAALGVFSSLLLTTCALVIVVFPGFATIATSGFVPLLIYEITLGLWLLLRGASIQSTPAHAA